MVEPIEVPESPELSTFVVPEGTKIRLAGLYQEWSNLDIRMKEIVQTAAEARGLVGIISQNYDVPSGVVTYTLAIAPVPMNRAQRKRQKKQG